jgi:tRNA 2-selenouridine synthase
MTADALDINDFLAKSEQDLIVDVRSPVEFFKGHLYNAVNIPLFEDIERAEIGTLYKQQGKDTAVSRGMEIVSPKFEFFLDQAKALSRNKKIFVYCFRGGMRSNSFAWLMNQNGLNAQILKGGYKAYRNHVLNYFEKDRKIILLGGKTGSGKTDILKKLAETSNQVIDLERIAHHKGSAFGSINEKKQNPQQVFENTLYHKMTETDPTLPLIMENESQNIGYNKIPSGLWYNMKKSAIIKLNVPFELRVEKLVTDYATVNINELKDAVMKIAQQLGLLNTKNCLHYLDEGNLAEVARLSLLYYDKAYEHHKTEPRLIIPIDTDTADAEINAKKIKEVLDSLNE